jgi:redox-sensitive bicupin YhaK (pirin superfamily)
MFPLLDPSAPNPLELFQIWLNLPAKSKMAAPHFTMLWSEAIPRLAVQDEAGRTTEIAPASPGGSIPAGGRAAASRRPTRGASEPDADLAIWTIRLAPGARWTLSAAAGAGDPADALFLQGRFRRVAAARHEASVAIELRAGAEVELANAGEAVAEFLLLQAGRSASRWCSRGRSS